MLRFKKSLAVLFFAGTTVGTAQFVLSSAPAPTAPLTPSAYRPITGEERMQWVVSSTVSPPSIIAGGISAGWGTLFNTPSEYDTHWDGVGKRFGMRMTGVATSNAMEAGVGALWGEDPRYHRAVGQRFGRRVKHTIKMTFFAYNRDGQEKLAYARFAGISGSNFLSNTWRADSEADSSHAVMRIGLGFASRLGANAFSEFWPDAKRHLFKRVFRRGQK